MRYYLSAGEASGDLHASRLMMALRRADSEAQFSFMGGPGMRAAGGECIIRSEELAFMGFKDVMLHYKEIQKAGKSVQKYLLESRPDVVICVDYPGFHFRYLLPFVHRHLPHTRLVYYIPPKVWAWKRYRIRQLRTLTDLVLCIFPFEVPFFEKYQLPQAKYMGNPSMDAVLSYLQSSRQPESEESPSLALVCGSRQSEIRKNLPTMLRVARDFPQYTPVIPVARGLPTQLFEEIHGIEHAKLVYNDTYGVIRRASAALVTSGTATLETALLGTPQVVCYAVGGGWLANWVFRHLFTAPYISLVNLNAGKEVVKELFGGKFTVKNIRSALAELLPDAKDPLPRSTMLHEYDLLRDHLKPDRSVADTAAREILNLF